jgi:phospholipid-binding lipoprotein MlaA
MMKSILTVAVLATALAGCSGRNAFWSTFSIKPTPAPSNSDIAPDDELDDLDALDQELEGDMKVVSDPLEGWNRKIFAINDDFFVWVVKPALKGYKAVVPEPVRVGMRNSFDNLGMPARGINCLLQGKGKAAETEFHRFLINTTVGILGVRDAAGDDYQIKAPPPEDLGQTLAVWGVGDGCYLVWPVFGPSTIRDSGGAVGDYFLDPVTYIPPWTIRLGVSGTRAVNNGSFTMKEYDAIREEAIDPYAAVRDGYTQYRSAQIKE